MLVCYKSDLWVVIVAEENGYEVAGRITEILTFCFTLLNPVPFYVANVEAESWFLNQFFSVLSMNRWNFDAFYLTIFLKLIGISFLAVFSLEFSTEN